MRKLLAAGLVLAGVIGWAAWAWSWTYADFGLSTYTAWYTEPYKNKLWVNKPAGMAVVLKLHREADNSVVKVLTAPSAGSSTSLTYQTVPATEVGKVLRVKMYLTSGQWVASSGTIWKIIRTASTSTATRSTSLSATSADAATVTTMEADPIPASDGLVGP